jgi:DNA-directed RNA polymerase subunit RPC12/RpoP
MTCWNNFDINEFQQKGKNDMMQCVTCNKSFLFAPRLKTSNENPFIIRKISKCSWNERLIHSYMKLRCQQHYNTT